MTNFVLPLSALFLYYLFQVIAAWNILTDESLSPLEMSLLNNRHVFRNAARAKPRASFFWQTLLWKHTFMTDTGTKTCVGRECATRGAWVRWSSLIDLCLQQTDVYAILHIRCQLPHTTPYATRVCVCVCVCVCVETEQADSRMSATNRRNSMTVVDSHHRTSLGTLVWPQNSNSLRWSIGNTAPLK